MNKWAALDGFVVAARLGSFAAAAAELGVDPSTVGKMVKRLETELSVRLFQRTTRRLSLTQEGHEYLSTVIDAFAALDHSELRIQNRLARAEGTLRVNAPLTYGREYIAPALKSFQELYPDVNIELKLDDSYVDLVDSQVDVAIRTGSLADSQWVARKLSPMDFLTCASPALANTLPSPFLEEHYNQAPWIRFRFKESGRLMKTIGTASGKKDKTHRADIVVDDGNTMAELCAAGLGIAQLPHFVLKPFIDSGRLVPILPYHAVADWSVYVFYANRTFLPLKTRVFIDHLVEYVAGRGDGVDSTWLRSLTVNH